MNAFEWADATSVDEIFQLTVKGSVIKAGGVDLVDLMKEGISQPTRIVNIRRIPGWDQIKEDDDGVKIGPLATLAQIADDPVINQKYTALAQAAGHAATPQIRNMATIGGNILQRPRCWYFRSELFHCRKKGGEICYAQEGENQYHAIFNNGLCAIVHPSGAAAAMIAMGAKIELTSPSNKREISLEDFITPPTDNLHAENSLAPDEVVTQIMIPSQATAAKSFYIKQAEKESFDWAIAETAAVMEMDGKTCKNASIVLGAAAPTPHRVAEAQDMLKGKTIDEPTVRAAAKEALKSATPLALNGYKIPLFETIITRAVLAAAGVNS